MANQKITANCRQIFTPKVAGVPEIRLDLEALTVDSVQLDGQNIAFTHQNKVVRVVFPTALNPLDTAEVRVFYHGKPVTTSWGGFYFQSGYAYNLGVGIGTEPPVFGRAWFAFRQFRGAQPIHFSNARPGGQVGVLQRRSGLSRNPARRARTPFLVPQRTDTLVFGLRGGGAVHGLGAGFSGRNWPDSRGNRGGGER